MADSKSDVLLTLDFNAEFYAGLGEDEWRLKNGQATLPILNTLEVGGRVGAQQVLNDHLALALVGKFAYLDSTSNDNDLSPIEFSGFRGAVYVEGRWLLSPSIQMSLGAGYQVISG